MNLETITTAVLLGIPGAFALFFLILTLKKGY